MVTKRTLLVATASGLAMLFTAPAAAAQDSWNPAIVRDTKEWHLRDSLSGGPATNTFVYGRSGDSQHMMCDWNGDGTRTPGVIRMIDGSPHWLLRNSNSGGPAHHSFVYGREGDRAICGDWNGDGVQTPGITRQRATGLYEWHLRNSVSGGAAHQVVLYARDQYEGELPPSWPVVGDWNGDGTDTLGLVQGHPDGQLQWLLRDSNTGGTADYDFAYYDSGVWGDHLEIHIPIVGDWNGDGRDGPGVTRASGSVSPQWLLRNDRSAGFADHVFRYGGIHMDVTLSWR